jgi:hypothetical protein
MGTDKLCKIPIFKIYKFRMKILLIIVGLLFFVTVLPSIGQDISFASRVNGKYVFTKLDKAKFDSASPSLFKYENGKAIWLVTSTVTIQEAASSAIQEAKRVLGDNFLTSWSLREASRHVSGTSGKYFHHYLFEFRSSSETDNLQVIVTLDGKVIETGT